MSALETDVLREVWSLGAARIAELVEQLNSKRPESPIQRGTVHVLLRRLEEKGWIEREKEGRSFIYTATISEQRGIAEIASEFGEQVFDGSPVALVQSLVDSRGLKKRDIEQLRSLLDDAENKLKRKPKSNIRRKK